MVSNGPEVSGCLALYKTALPHQTRIPQPEWLTCWDWKISLQRGKNFLWSLEARLLCAFLLFCPQQYTLCLLAVPTELTGGNKAGIEIYIHSGTTSSRIQLELTVFLLSFQVLAGCPRSQEAASAGRGQEGGGNLARVSSSRSPKRNQPGFSQLWDNQSECQRRREIHIWRCPGLLNDPNHHVLNHFTTDPLIQIRGFMTS